MEQWVSELPEDEKQPPSEGNGNGGGHELGRLVLLSEGCFREDTIPCRFGKDLWRKSRKSAPEFI